MEDITRRKLYQAQIEELAFTDPLTGLSNRRHLYDEGERLLSAAQQQGSSIALLYLDLDRFKAFNDALGHDAGDELLQQVTERLQSCVEHEQGVLLARLGGDEFAVLMSHADVERAIALGQRMLEHIRRPFLLHKQRVHLGGSIGIALGPVEQAAFPVLLTRADIAMYRIKASGGGIQVYDASFSLAYPDQLQLETDLRWALVTDSLMLYYQPILDVPSGRIVGAEALVRWWHPERGLLGPDAFLPLAEETGLMRVLDGWVLGNVLAQMAAWSAAGYTFDVAVNLTAYSLQNLELVAHIADLLTITDVAPERVIIELTEHTALRDLETTQQVLQGLNDLGLRIALDDFGNGYASLTYLQQVPVDILKIDRTFTTGVGNNSRNEAVIRALLGLARDMGMLLVVEGVEEPGQLEWLKAAGCQWVQGFLIGKPMPPEMFSRML
jgi:diguanylate cyclase (GGDEF)-like protein